MSSHLSEALSARLRSAEYFVRQAQDAALHAGLHGTYEDLQMLWVELERVRNGLPAHGGKLRTRPRPPVRSSPTVRVPQRLPFDEGPGAA